MNAGQRVAVITGASQDLGLETARQLLEHDFKVVLTARRLFRLCSEPQDAGKVAQQEARQLLVDFLRRPK